MKLCGSRSMTAGRRQGRGFTVIELLVVISIILFLVGVLTAVFLRQGETNRIRATQKLIERVSLALERYYAEFREYPPDSGYGLDRQSQSEMVTSKKPYQSDSLYYYLGTELHKYRIYNNAPELEKSIAPYMEFSPGELIPYEADGRRSYIVVDSWRNPIGYVGHPWRVLHRRGECDVYSAGPDGKTASDLAQETTCDAYRPNGTIVDSNASNMGAFADNGGLTAAMRTLPSYLPADPKPPRDDVNNWDAQR